MTRLKESCACDYNQRIQLTGVHHGRVVDALAVMRRGKSINSSL
jgi:hypothetical protein